MNTKYFVAGRRSGKQKFTLAKLREKWEQGELTASFSGNYEFIHKPEVDAITHKLIVMDWITAPEDRDILEEYKRILASLPKDTYDELIHGNWELFEDEE